MLSDFEKDASLHTGYPKRLANLSTATFINIMAKPEQGFYAFGNSSCFWTTEITLTSSTPVCGAGRRRFRYL
jgi:hypothetical protein